MDIAPDYLLENLDNIQILPEQIYHGRLHEIKKCIITPTSQIGAFKTSNENIPNGPQSLIQEYNILARCSHPSIQNVIGFYKSENEIENALITPYYDQGNLNQFDVIKDFSPTLKFIITLGITAGMKYLHKNGITHYNVKPENILLTDLKRPKLIHFGYPTFSIEKKDNLMYQAPEVISNEIYTQKSDVYSFGLIINELYSNQKIISDINIDEMIKIKKNGNIPISGSIPKFMKDIIIKCLKVNPSERPSFKDIFGLIKSNCYKMQNSALISSYLREISFGRKRKNIFRIPHQILKLPSEEFPWNMETPSPINWDEFDKVFPPESNDKALLIMTFGGFQTGKSTFLRTITRNQAHFSGTGISTTTLGLLIDGPYKKSELIENIFDDEFKARFDNVNIPDETLIYFIDSQGIGDETYLENYCIVLDRIHSIFSSISSFCITLTDINAPYEVIQKVLKIIRRIQFSHFNTIYFLVKGYEKFDKLDDISFDSINEFQNSFIEEYWNQYQNTSKYYAYKFIYPISIGNCKSNYENYLYSCWYALNYMLLHVNNNSIHPISETRLQLKNLPTFLFGKEYKEIYNAIIENPNESITNILGSFPESQKTTGEVIKLCCSCCYYMAETLSDFLRLPREGQYNDQEVSSIIIFFMNSLYKIVFPYFFGDFNIPLADYIQYISEMSKDANSYLKANFDNWKTNMKIDGFISKIQNPILLTSSTVIIASIFIPVGFAVEGVCSVINYGFGIYNFITNKKRSKIKKEFIPTIFPFIWNRNMTKMKIVEYNLDTIKQIGGNNDQLIVFYDQNGNDSSLLFRSLTGIDVDFQDKKRYAQLFSNISIKKLMERYKRYKNVHSSKLEDKRVNFLYVKGCNPGEIISLCHTHQIRPIFVSSILNEQKLSISPEDNCIFNLFYVSENVYNEFRVDRKMFLACMKSESMKIIKQSIQMKHGELLPIKAKNFNFNEAGPLAHALIRYGCKFILQDKKFDKQ